MAAAAGNHPTLRAPQHRVSPKAMRYWATRALANLTRPAPRAPVVVAGSPLDGGAVFRIAGERVDLVTGAVRALIGEACGELGAIPWQRRW